MSVKEGDSPSIKGDNSERVKYTENLFLQNQQAKINQTWYKLSFGVGNSREFKFVQIRGQALFKGEIITEM